MRKDFLLGIGATLIAMAFFYYRDHSSQTNLNTVLMNDESKSSLSQKKSTSDQGDVQNPVENPVSTVSTTVTADDELKNSRAKRFAEHLTALSKCFHIHNQVESDKIEPTYDNLLVSLRPAIGDLVVQMDDWSQLDLQMPSGERRRLRTEVNYENPNQPTKYVQLFIMQNDLPIMMDIDKEKSMNPTDDFIAELRADGKLLLDEKGSRVYFQEGEEIIVIERSGILESFSMTKSGISFSCSELSTDRSNCQCLD